MGVPEPDGVTQATCALSALRNCSSVIAPRRVALGEADTFDTAPEADNVAGEVTPGWPGGTNIGRNHAQPLSRDARKEPATTSTVMLIAGW